MTRAMTSAIRSQRLRADFPFEADDGTGKLARAGAGTMSCVSGVSGLSHAVADGSAEWTALFSWFVSSFPGGCDIVHFDRLHIVARGA